VGSAVVETGGAAMNDDDLLFSVDDIAGWKRGERPDGWLEDRKNVLLARCHAQTAWLKKLLASVDPETARRLNNKII